VDVWTSLDARSKGIFLWGERPPIIWTSILVVSKAASLHKYFALAANNPW